MKRLANALTAFVAVSHIGFLILEMFLWNTPTGQSAFGLTPEFAAATAVLAMNQGLYNGFLAAGLIWGLWTGEQDVKRFFLICVVVAGVFGGFTAGTQILFIQALPALIALGCVWLAEK